MLHATGQYTGHGSLSVVEYTIHDTLRSRGTPPDGDPPDAAAAHGATLGGYQVTGPGSLVHLAPWLAHASRGAGAGAGARALLVRIAASFGADGGGAAGVV